MEQEKEKREADQEEGQEEGQEVDQEEGQEVDQEEQEKEQKGEEGQEEGQEGEEGEGQELLLWLHALSPLDWPEMVQGPADAASQEGVGGVRVRMEERDMWEKEEEGSWG